MKTIQAALVVISLSFLPSTLFAGNYINESARLG